MDNFVGIDPGKSGALSSIGAVNKAIKMPLQGNDIDCRAIRDFLIETKPDFVVIEKVGAMPGQGVKSMFTFGQSYGTIIGIVDAMEIPYQLVTPQAWKKKVLAGTKKEKDDAINFVRRRYPETNLIPTERSKKPHDGIADATCMAHYAKVSET